MFWQQIEPDNDYVAGSISQIKSVQAELSLLDAN